MVFSWVDIRSFHPFESTPEVPYIGEAQANAEDDELLKYGIRPALFTDESVFGPTVIALRAAGWDIVRAVDTCPGASDDVVLRWAYELQRVLVTEDFDFGDLVVRRRLDVHGLVVVSLSDIGAAAKPDSVVMTLGKHAADLRGSLLRVEPARVRIRPLNT